METYGIAVKAFADDVKMYVRIVNDVNLLQLQHAIDSLLRWAEEWQLTVSVDKCCVLNIGHLVLSSDHLRAASLIGRNAVT